MKRVLIPVMAGLLFLCALCPVAGAAKRTEPVYSIQVASFQNPQEAESRVKALRSKGFDVFYVKALISGKAWYRVCMGIYATPAEALRDAEVLKKKGVIGDYTLRRVHRSEMLNPPAAKAGPPRKEEPKAAAEKPKNGRPSPAEPGEKPAAAPPAPAETVQEAPAARKETPEAKPQPAEAAPEPVRAEEARAEEAQAEEARREEPGAKPGASLLEVAASDFKAGRYEAAAQKFEETLQKNALDGARREAAMRGLADSLYFLGEQGSKADLQKAVDAYGKLLAAYPGVKDENAASQLRLARCHLLLNNNPEAYREFETLLARYPKAPQSSEAVFAMGVLQYRFGKYTQAIDRFKDYLARYPDGEYAKHSHFWIADCYNQLKDQDQAEIWYRDGLRKFPPDRSDLPKEVLIGLGFHFFRNAKYREASDTFFQYINLYPEDGMRKEVTYVIGRCLTEMNAYGPALKMFSLVLEKYPGTREAQESAMIMANIAVKNPDLRFPNMMPGAENVRDPVATYDELLRKAPPPDVAEGILFQKAYALFQRGRHPEAFDTFDALARRYPAGRFKAAGTESLKKSADALIERYYAQQDYLAVTDVYYRVYENGLVRGYDAKTGLRIAESLKQVGLYGEADRFFSDLVKRAEKKAQGGIHLSLAEIQYREGKYDAAEAALQSLVRDASGLDRKEITRARRLLADVYLQKGLPQKAAAAYAEALKTGQEPDEPAVVHRNYAAALQDLNALPSAVDQYQKALKFYAEDHGKYPAGVAVDAYTGIGDCLFRERKYQHAMAAYSKSLEIQPESRQNLWSLYSIGRGYLSQGDVPSANRVFSELKVKSGEDFWTRVADYSVSEHEWAGKYRGYLKAE